MELLGLTRDRVARAVALAGLDHPAAARAATEALDVLLAGVRESAHPDLAWRYSRLTSSGFPLELSFSTASTALRYTVEVGGPELASEMRLDRAMQLLRRLSPSFEVPDQLAGLIARAQAADHLGWGAWIGGRHTSTEASFKLYAEVPRAAVDAAQAISAAYLGKQPLLSHRQPRMKGVGWEAALGLLELYYRVDGLEVWETGALLDRLGLAARQSDLLDLIQEALGRPVRRALPRMPFGFSYTFGADGAPVGFSLFNYVQALFGPDGKVRRQLLTVADIRHWNLSGYARVSEGLAIGDRPTAAHTVMAFSVLHKKPPVLTVGLVPPE